MASVTKARIERLKKHLLQIEKETGMPLEDKGSDYMCPIKNFAPAMTSQGHVFCCTGDGVNYGFPQIHGDHEVEIKLHDNTDVNWYMNLNGYQKAEVYTIIRQWLKERMS